MGGVIVGHYENNIWSPDGLLWLSGADKKG